MPQDKNEKIKSLRQLIRHHDELYFNKSAPVISDAEYDELKRELEFLEASLPEEDKFSYVGSEPDPRFSKIKHSSPMLSLSNAFNEQDVYDFLIRVKKLLDDQKEFSVLCEPKIDGLSFSAVFKDGKLEYAATRGDGAVGEDITHTIKKVKNFPQDVHRNLAFEVRGEVFMTKQNFFLLNEKCEKDGQDKFANPRNAASGSLRQLDASITESRNLNYMLWGGFIEGVETQSEMMKRFKSIGFDINEISKVCRTYSEVIDFYKNIEGMRSNLEYDIDGVVYKVDEFECQNQLGNVSRSPRWAIAHKFEAEKALTKIIDIVVQVGRTGVMTPVANLQPVNIGGVIVSRATLHNQDEIDRKDIRIGDWVNVQRAGDVIPQVLSVDLAKRTDDVRKFVMPSNCNICGSVAIKIDGEAATRCMGGLKCDAQVVERLKHFVSRDAFNIDGLGESGIQQLYDEGLIATPLDLFNLDYDKIKKLDGWGAKSVQHLRESVEISREISLDRFIYSLGIRHVGKVSAKLLADNFDSIDQIITASKDELIAIKGLGDVIVEEIKAFFAESFNADLIRDLTSSININKKSNVTYQKSYLFGKVIVFTGSLSSMSRSKAKELAEKHGAIVAESISKKVDIVIVGDDAGSKLEKAKQLNLYVIPEDKWLELLSA